MEDNIPGGCQRAEAVVDSEMVELEVEATEVDECAGGGGEPLTAAVCHFSAARAGEWGRHKSILCWAVSLLCARYVCMYDDHRPRKSNFFFGRGVSAPAF